MDRVMGPFLRWAATLLVQGLVLRDAVWFDGWACPSLHLMGLLLLPLALSPTTLLLMGGITGIALDFMTAGGGLWTSSGLLFGALLGLVNRLLAPREGYEMDSRPTTEDQGWGWFITRALILVVAHDLWRFGLEAGRWGLRWQTMPMAITSALATTTLIVLIHMLFRGNRRTR
jgi:hypothetical protein